MNPNVDLKEIAKFESMSSRWWDLKGECKFLHCINPFRLSYIAEHSGGLFGKRILDIGCGGGILTESMIREGAIVTGLDVSLQLIQIARLHAFQEGIEVNYVYETIEEHAVKNPRKYHIITCMEILEHTPNPKSVVTACSKMVKFGGHVFFSTINRSNKAWLIAVVFGEYLFRIIPKGTHDFKKFITPSELLSWIDKTTLREKNIIGICYNPLSNKFRFISDVSVNYILHVMNE